MSRKTFRIFICIMAVIIGALIGMNVAQENRKTWDVEYEMANKRIVWAGAGYNGINGR